MVQTRLVTTPDAPPPNADLMVELLKAIAERRRFDAYDCIDALIDPDDLPCRQDGGWQPRKAMPR